MPVLVSSRGLDDSVMSHACDCVSVSRSVYFIVMGARGPVCPCLSRRRKIRVMSETLHTGLSLTRLCVCEDIRVLSETLCMGLSFSRLCVLRWTLNSLNNRVSVSPASVAPLNRSVESLVDSDDDASSVDVIATVFFT